MKPLLLGLLLFSAGCDKAPAPDPVRERRAAAERRAQAVLDGLDQKMADLRARAESSAAHAKSDIRETLARMEEKKTSVQVRLDELKASSKETARDAADRLERASDDLEASFRDAASRFK